MTGTTQMALGEWINLVGVVCVGIGLIWQARMQAQAEGIMQQRMVQNDRDIAELKQTQAEHAKQLASGQARFATIETKLDQVLRQQDRLIASIDKALEQLAQQKD